MRICRWLIGGVLALMLFGPAPRTSFAADNAADDPSFKLQEVSVFDLKGTESTDPMSAVCRPRQCGVQHEAVPRGQSLSQAELEAAALRHAGARLATARRSDGDAGWHRRGAPPQSFGAGVKFYFVLDQSEEAAKADEKQPADQSREKSTDKEKKKADREKKKAEKKAKKDTTAVASGRSSRPRTSPDCNTTGSFWMSIATWTSPTIRWSCP